MSSSENLRTSFGTTRSSSVTHNNNNNIGNNNNLNSNSNNQNNNNNISNPKIPIDQFKDLVDIIATTPDYAIVLSKRVDSAEMDHLAKALLNVCSHKGTTIALIYGLLQEEFTTNQVNTILRGNSLATKVETAFSRLVGQKYIKELFGDIILRLVTDIGLNLATTVGKIDAEGVKAEVRVEENRQRVLDVAQEFVDRFTSEEMKNKMPRAIRSICGFTAHFAKLYHPERVLPFLGGFILLRFFNPAIITPESLNMLPEGISPTPQDRQNFIAITRLLQKLSNQVMATDAEEQHWINPFIERNHEKMCKYLQDLAYDPLTSDDESKAYADLLLGDGDIYTEEQKRLIDKNVMFLNTLLYENGIFVLSELSKRPPVRRGDQEVYLNGEFLRLQFNLHHNISPQPFKHDLLSKKTLFLPSREFEIEGMAVGTRIGQTISITNHMVYIFGGNYIDGTTITGNDCLLVGNLCSFKWHREGSDDAPSRKYHSSVIYDQTLILVFGGMYNKECLNDMHEYDTITKTWRQVQYVNAAPLPRYGHSMDIIDHKLYIFGGYCFDGKKYYYTNSTLIFDLRTRTWNNNDQEVIGNAPSERMHHSTVVYDNAIWLFGGRTPDMEALGDLYRLDIQKNEWVSIQCIGVRPQPRWSNSMNLSGKRMILFGGCSDIETFDDAYEFSFDTLKWDKLDCASPFGPKNYQLADHSACIYNGRLITFFGGTYTANGQLTTLTHELTFDLYYVPPSTLSQDFKSLINAEFMSDCNIQLGDDSVLRCHKLILYSRCPILYSMIEASADHQSIKLEGLNMKQALVILTFIYSGEIDVSVVLDIKTILTIIMWGYKLDLAELVRILELRLVKKINERSLLDLLLSAEKYQLRVLELECIKLFKFSSQNDYTSIFPFERCSSRILSLIGHQIFPTKQ